MGKVNVVRLEGSALSGVTVSQFNEHLAGRNEVANLGALQNVLIDAARALITKKHHKDKPYIRYEVYNNNKTLEISFDRRSKLSDFPNPIISFLLDHFWIKRSKVIGKVIYELN